MINSPKAASKVCCFGFFVFFPGGMVAVLVLAVGFDGWDKSDAEVKAQEANGRGPVLKLKNKIKKIGKVANLSEF